jgi:drug/metabolite transporter (DMT)-like permease
MWTVPAKVFSILGLASGCVLCFGSALMAVGLLYNETSLANTLVFVFYTLSATAAGFYFYFRILKLISAKRRVYSYPTANRPSH